MYDAKDSLLSAEKFRRVLARAMPNGLPKLLLAVVAIVVLFSVQSEAALNLPPPKELLKKASQDRRTLREALLDLQQNISEMRDPATFDSYFYLLVELEAVAERTQLNAIFPKAVQQTGLKDVYKRQIWL